jgi:hypothetical protein
MRRILLIAWLAGFPLAASAATPVLVADLDPRLASRRLAEPARAGSRIVFILNPGHAGRADLWASDGTASGTGSPSRRSWPAAPCQPFPSQGTGPASSARDRCSRTSR